MDYLLSEADLTLEIFEERGADKLPGHLGFQIMHIGRDKVEGRFDVAQHLMAPNGFLHGGTVVAFADTLSGYGTVAHLPAGATGFTTIELKTNFFSTALSGGVRGVATPVHVGGATQVWDVEMWSEETDKRMALFRCTNLVLRPKS
ncbi:MAG: PaaI family thioesterase [Pseudomonadota bacterium]